MHILFALFVSLFQFMKCFALSLVIICQYWHTIFRGSIENSENTYCTYCMHTLDFLFMSYPQRRDRSAVLAPKRLHLFNSCVSKMNQPVAWGHLARRVRGLTNALAKLQVNIQFKGREKWGSIRVISVRALAVTATWFLCQNCLVCLKACQAKSISRHTIVNNQNCESQKFL